MARRVVITGSEGQDGYYLRKMLEDECLIYDPGDVTDPWLMHKVEGFEPHEIYNLAAVYDDHEDPLIEVNTLAVQELLQAARKSGARFVQASSCEIFGQSAAPQCENTCHSPLSEYAVSKLAAHKLVGVYRDKYGVHASSAILFNHESPRRVNSVVKKICQAAADIAAGKQDTLALGNLHVRRDWGHAKDYVRGMVAMTRHHQGGDYVLATGHSHSVADVCEMAFEAAGVEHWRNHVVVDESLKREPDAQHYRGDASKAMRALGWRPLISFEETVKEMVAACTD